LQGIIGGAIRDGTGAKDTQLHDPHGQLYDDKPAPKAGDFDVFGV
ncbi:MAG: hypothetical protein GY761_13315, partial [Hyphomicrobiales bacterium]|nr:hypothetical protein [Hyphomicrobiales bacterium]